jgi:hypothetical protein
VIPQSYPEITQPPSEFAPDRQLSVKDGDSIPLKAGAQGTPGCTVFDIAALGADGEPIAGCNFSNFVYDSGDGSYTGSFVMGPNATETVRLRVILQNVDGLSDPDQSIGNALPVNNVDPFDLSIEINQGAAIATGRAVTLTLAAKGAYQYYILGRRLEEMPGFPGVFWEVGDVESQPGITDTWLPYRTFASVELWGENGIKTVEIKYRSDAWIESEIITDTIDLQVPADFPMALPFGTIQSITRRANGHTWGVSSLNNMGYDFPSPVSVYSPVRMGSMLDPQHYPLNHVKEIGGNVFGPGNIQIRAANACEDAPQQVWIWGKRYEAPFTGQLPRADVEKVYQGTQIKSIAAGGSNGQFQNQDTGFRAFVDEYSILRRWGRSDSGQLGNGSYSADCWKYPGPVDGYTCSKVFCGLRSMWTVKGGLQELYATGDNTGFILGIVEGEEEDGDNVDSLKVSQQAEVIVKTDEKNAAYADYLNKLAAYSAALNALPAGNVRYDTAINNEIYWRDFYSNWKSWYRIDPYNPTIWDNYALALANWPPAKAEVADSASDLRDLYVVVTVNDSTNNFIGVNADYIAKSEAAAEAKQEYLYQARLPGTPAEFQAALDAWNVTLANLSVSNQSRINTYTALPANPKLTDFNNQYVLYVDAYAVERQARRVLSLATVTLMADSQNAAKQAAKDQAQLDWQATVDALFAIKEDLDYAASLLQLVTRERVVSDQVYTDSQQELAFAQASVTETNQILTGMAANPRVPMTNVFTRVAGGAENTGWKSIHSCPGSFYWQPYTLGLKADGSLWFWGGREYGFPRLTATEVYFPPIDGGPLSDRRVIKPRQIPGTWNKVVVAPQGTLLFADNNDIFEAYGNKVQSYWGMRKLDIFTTRVWIDGYRWTSTIYSDPEYGEQYPPNYVLLDNTGKLWLHQYDEAFSGYTTVEITNNKLFSALAIGRQCFFGLQIQGET